MGKHELMRFISSSDYARLRSRLRMMDMRDDSSGDNGECNVRSLYFDCCSNSALLEKLSGLVRREKYSIRYCNGDMSHIRLEKTSKPSRVVFSEDAEITTEQCVSLLARDFESLKLPDTPLLMDFFAQVYYGMLRPKSIADYHREVYTCNGGKVRVTFDTSIRVSDNVSGFLNPWLATTPAAEAIVMEVNYDGLLPDYIRDIVHVGWRRQADFSKLAAVWLG